jgi:glutamine---fructose-6-phosphate transaminase (isomerizing)
MCGIVVCVGDDVGDKAVSGLKNLEYRGYDSFGFASWSSATGMSIRKSIDPLAELADRLPEANVVIGHTRWATHGEVSIENCHPIVAGDGAFALIHNGIVENFDGFNHQADPVTDSALISCLLSDALQTFERGDAVRHVFSSLSGRNVIVVLFADGEIVAIRKGSPLVMGRDETAIYLASDILGFTPWANEYLDIPEDRMLRIHAGSAALVDAEWAPNSWTVMSTSHELPGKAGYPHYMLKEINEQWMTISAQAHGAATGLAPMIEAISRAKTVVVTGAGGAFYAARQIACQLRDIAGVAALEVEASEIKRVQTLTRPGDLLLAISQSGETADTLSAVAWARGRGMPIASLVNRPESSLVRASDCACFNHAGPEICVLSTKSATAQVAFGFVLAHGVRGNTDCAIEVLDRVSQSMSQYLNEETLRHSRALANELADVSSLYILGSAEHYGTAQIAALNIKEASYIHAEAFAAGELKHGVLALIEKDVPVIVYLDGENMSAAIHEVRARGAKVIGIGAQRHPAVDCYLRAPGLTEDLPVGIHMITAIVPGQLLAYALATAKGIDPDRPRNLAKSVTVS